MAATAEVKQDWDAIGLKLVRVIFKYGSVGKMDLSHWGIQPENLPDSWVLGDYRILPLIKAAGSTPGFGDDPIDATIDKFLAANFGIGWRNAPVIRPPHPWEPRCQCLQQGPSNDPGDAELNELHRKTHAAIDAHRNAEARMWAAKDDLRAAGKTANTGMIARAAREVDAAVEALEVAYAAERVARCAETTRQLEIGRQHRACN